MPTIKKLRVEITCSECNKSKEVFGPHADTTVAYAKEVSKEKGWTFGTKDDRCPQCSKLVILLPRSEAFKLLNVAHNTMWTNCRIEQGLEYKLGRKWVINEWCSRDRTDCKYLMHADESSLVSALIEYAEEARSGWEVHARRIGNRLEQLRTTKLGTLELTEQDIKGGKVMSRTKGSYRIDAKAELTSTLQFMLDTIDTVELIKYDCEISQKERDVLMDLIRVALIEDTQEDGVLEGLLRRFEDAAFYSLKD